VVPDKIPVKPAPIYFMAELNGKQYVEWEEYIRDKFSAPFFNITEDKSTSSANVITVTAKEPAIKTRIVFDFPTAGLCRTCFYHENSPHLNADNEKERLRALMYADFEISDENLANTDEYLKIPLYFGWTEQVINYKDQLVKSDLLYYDGVSWQTIPLERHINWFDKVGCLTAVIAWPVLYVQAQFVKHKLTTDNKHVTVTSNHILPMIGQEHSTP
jgi:hypothetical protein